MQNYIRLSMRVYGCSCCLTTKTQFAVSILILKHRHTNIKIYRRLHLCVWFAFCTSCRRLSVTTYYVHVYFGKKASGGEIDVNVHVEREREQSPDSRRRAVAPATATWVPACSVKYLLLILTHDNTDHTASSHHSLCIPHSWISPILALLLSFLFSSKLFSSPCRCSVSIQCALGLSLSLHFLV